MKKSKVLLKGVIPSNKVVPCTVYKSAKKGLKSFRITSSMLNNILKKSGKANGLSQLVITIPANTKESFVLTCKVTKVKT